jgi:tetrahydromethanopterin S-methyltransferase subunit E
MPDRIQIQRPESRTRDRHAWLPEAIHGAALVALALAVASFVQVFFRVRGKLGMEGEKGWALVIGFVLIELYLLLRVRRQVTKARDTYRRGHPGSPKGV